MVVFYANDYYLHVPKYEYYDGRQTPHAEKPDRIARILDGCEKLKLEIREINKPIPKSAVLPLHKSNYVAYLKNKCLDIRNEDQVMPSVFIKDTYTPLTRHTYEAALKSANLAFMGAEALLKEKQKHVYALCRPPGHHAEKDAMAGYCYFNNAAIAAQELSKKGKVAIIDIDYHHGNGTQQLFYERSDVMYVSLHARPDQAFPFTTGSKDERGSKDGEGFNHNIPLALETTPTQYLQALKSALSIVDEFNPQYVVLSLGFDTYANDPIGGLGLEEESFEDIGKLIGTLDQPLLIVQEGGYEVSKLSTLANYFLSGFLKSNT